MSRRSIAGLAFAVSALAACGGGKAEADVCANKDGALGRSAFVFVQSPASGKQVTNGFRVSGCSNTFEATVNWRLQGRDGRALASGFAQGGSGQPGPFSFTVSYSVGVRQIGQLEIYEPSVTTEGFPTVKNIVPVVLAP